MQAILIDAGHCGITPVVSMILKVLVSKFKKVLMNLVLN